MKDAVEHQIPLRRLDVVDSTMLEARRRIRAGDDGPFAIVAAEQTGGYGRHARQWHSPRGGAWMTVALAVAGETPTRAVGLRVGVAVSRVVMQSLDSPQIRAGDVRLKWPNDVLVKGRKVCGVLCERVFEGGAEWLLVGVGLNVNNQPRDLPDGLRTPATSLAAELGRSLAMDPIIESIPRRVVAALLSDSPQDAIEWAASHLWRLGEPVSVTTGETQTIRGILRGLSDDGRMILEVEGRRVVVPEGSEVVGEASHRLA